MPLPVDRCPNCESIEISLRYNTDVDGESDRTERTGKCWDCGYEWSSVRTSGQPWS